MSTPIKPSFSSFFAEGQYQTQVEMLETGLKNESIAIGILKENTLNEHRVPIVPNSVRTLAGYGHKVIVESGAGDRSSYSDNDFSEAGATIAFDSKRVFDECDIIVKSAPPSFEELDSFKEKQILISPIHLPLLTKEYLIKLKEKKVISIAMEYLKSESGSFPVVRVLSEMAGLGAVLTAAELLSNTKGGRGVLLGGISGVPPAKIVILGAGIVAEYATRIALGLGASVRIFDNDIYKIMRLQKHVGRQLHTSTINPVYLGYQLTSADVVIGAIHAKSGRTPIIVTEEMVSKMKAGSVIVDVSIDQGGCVETSEVTTHSNPTFTKHDVIHYCVPNIASKVSRTASIAVSNILTPILLQIGKYNNINQVLFNNSGIKHGVYTYKGCLTNEYLARRFEQKYTSLSLLLTSGL